MKFSRNSQLKALEKFYGSDANEAIVVYSSSSGDADDIIKEFLTDKDFFYYRAIQVSPEEQVKLFCNSIKEQLPKVSSDICTYADAFKAMLSVKCNKRVIVIDEFQYIVRFSADIVSEAVNRLNNKWENQPFLFILTSSNSYFVENQMVSKLESSAYEISGIIKISDLTFTDIVSNFDKYSTEDKIITYGITGGHPKLCECFDKNASLKDNIISSIMDENGPLFRKGMNILPPELREHSVYNTLLLNLASGCNKLNDIHVSTGYSRAKISVYLNNLMEHDLVVKLESFDSDGKDNTVKGIYKIKDGFTAFFYRFIYPNLSMLEILQSDKFYKSYIAPYINDFGSDIFKKVCTEYIMILNRLGQLPVKVTEFGTWLGKVGNIDIVGVDDKGRTIIGLCEFCREKMTFEDFEWLEFCVKQAKLNKDYFYLFSRKGFDERLTEYAESAGNVVLVDLDML